jgi:hypothetical protein
MKIIVESECRTWVEQNVGDDFHGTRDSEHFPHGADYLISPDSGKKTALARTTVQMLGADPSGLLWITGSGIWPSSQNMALFDGFRQSLGELRPVSVAPGHLYTSLSDSRRASHRMRLWTWRRRRGEIAHI